MKKIVNVFLIVMAFLTVSAATVMVKAAQNSEKQIKVTAEEKVDYFLPYPGVLPDSPLYSFKMIRDRLVGLLITDPVKKAEYNLLMADKRVNAGLMLVNYGKPELGITTISKGENYLTQAIDSLEGAKNQKKDILPLGEKFKRAITKHIEVLKEIKQKNSTVKSSVDQNLGNVESLKIRLEKLLRQ